LELIHELFSSILEQRFYSHIIWADFDIVLRLFCNYHLPQIAYFLLHIILVVFAQFNHSWELIRFFSIIFFLIPNKCKGTAVWGGFLSCSLTSQKIIINLKFVCQGQLLAELWNLYIFANMPYVLRLSEHICHIR